MDGNDKRWLIVDRKLHGFCRREVPKVATNLFGQPLESLIADVHGAMLRKFIDLRLERFGQSIEPLLRTVCRNEVISSLRRGRSPSTVGFDGAEKTWEAEAAATETDLFARVREHLGPFRFREYPHVREGVLAYFLSTHSMPGSTFLHAFAVGRSHRIAVYNAAVIDVNRAVMRACRA